MENLNVFNANEKPLENEYLTIGLSLELSLSFSHAPLFPFSHTYNISISPFHCQFLLCHKRMLTLFYLLYYNSRKLIFFTHLNSLALFKNISKAWIVSGADLILQFKSDLQI